MKLVVYYQNGLIDTFDSANFADAMPFQQEGVNLMTEFALRFDLLGSEGLVVDVFWYAKDPARGGTPFSTVDDRTGANLAHADFRQGRRIDIVAQDEIKDIAKITLDGELLAWRQGTELINGVKFFSQEVLCFSDDTVTGINRRASAVFDYLKNAYPDMTEDEIADLMGYTKDAIDEVKAQELANIEQDDDFEDVE